VQPAAHELLIVRRSAVGIQIESVKRLQDDFAGAATTWHDLLKGLGGVGRGAVGT